MGLNVVAAYLLLKLAGKDPSAADISALISSVGAEADAAQVELLLKELDGKDVNELIKDGKEKLKTVSMGGGGGGGAAPAAGAAAAAPAAGGEEKKKKEEKEEEADLGGGMDMFGGGGDGY